MPMEVRAKKALGQHFLTDQSIAMKIVDSLGRSEVRDVLEIGPGMGVLTQYRPLALNSYIGTGQHWDLDRLNGGVFVLPPYVTGSDGQWYSGTANAIYQNREFVDQYQPDYVLILSGDHIYKMNYSEMLRYHIRKEAAATIAVLPVPLEEAHRFGIMSTDAHGRITKFS